ncbi:hypothetical protein NUW54_g7147 [Trametes sanguinea]|uniref:Uncharacterized protein n=1 Tax=Trametes sanguinea TaxID=158606 RepID=A0ACC1PNS9_9APHY|nr:hypothetical protein NUW54_g7147 [Trametes sanguinea]
MVTELSDTARANADTITFSNSVTQFPVVVQNFNDIITTATKFTETLQQAEVLDEKGAKAVVMALTTFVEVHQALLNVVIGKHSIASRLFFTAPVAAVLRSLEAAIDALAFALIGLIPTEKDHANAQFDIRARVGKRALNLAINSHAHGRRPSRQTRSVFVVNLPEVAATWRHSQHERTAHHPDTVVFDSHPPAISHANNMHLNMLPPGPGSKGRPQLHHVCTDVCQPAIKLKGGSGSPTPTYGPTIRAMATFLAYTLKVPLRPSQGRLSVTQYVHPTIDLTCHERSLSTGMSFPYNALGRTLRTARQRAGSHMLLSDGSKDVLAWKRYAVHVDGRTHALMRSVQHSICWPETITTSATE